MLQHTNKVVEANKSTIPLRRKKTNEKAGGFNCTYSPALWQPKLYLLRQPDYTSAVYNLAAIAIAMNLYSGTIAIAPECWSLNCWSIKQCLSTFFTLAVYTPALWSYSARV